MDYWVFLETVFPYTAQCLVLSGTCCASVTEFRRRHYCRGAEAVSHGPDCLSDQRDSPVVGQSDRRPCCAGRAASRVVVQTCRKLWRIPQVQFLVTVYMPVVCSSGAVCQTALKLWMSRSCSSSQVVDFPFVPQRQLSKVPPYRQTVEIPQLQHVAWWLMPLHNMSCLTCLLLCNDRLGMAQIRKKTFWKYRRCSTFAVVDVAVISQRQSRLCREVPQTRSSTGCSSAEERCFCCSFAAFFGLRPSGR